MISSVVICGLMSAIFVVWRDFFAEIYTTDKAVLEYASIRMVHVLLFECLASSYEIGGAALRGGIFNDSGGAYCIGVVCV